MYIDETGNADLGLSEDPRNRLLGVTGVIITIDDVRDGLKPRLEELKGRFFDYDPDVPPILHRKELMNADGVFHPLRDSTTRREFNNSLIDLINSVRFTLISILIDKFEHRSRYGTWIYEPYNYCLAVLIERYVIFLGQKNAIGDVLAEARGKREDKRLKASFSGVWRHGTRLGDRVVVSAEDVQRRLGSEELKVLSKEMNVAGLQIADMFASPCRRDIARRNGLEERTDRVLFDDSLVAIAEESKYYRYPEWHEKRGQIDGCGRKKLP